jgi:hypothetical protein
MKIKNLLITTVLATVLLFSSISVSAMTEQERQSLINYYLTKIDELKARIAEAMAGQQSQTAPTIAQSPSERISQDWCYDFNRDIRYGTTGPDVEALHIALQKEGFTISAQEVSTKGFYNSTNTAVNSFQQKYAQEILTPFRLSRPTGFVGGTTRAKLNQLYGCQTITPTACAQDVRQCPDGSWVSRVPPDCNFAPCPTETTPQCTENNWIPTLSPTTCPSSGQQTRTWTKIGNCQGGVAKPAFEVVPCNYQAPTCNFYYTNWSECLPSGIQYRTITDSYPAGCQGGDPETSKTCTYTPPTCMPDWQCSTWSTCVNGQQTRNCTDYNYCGTIENRPVLSQSCVPIESTVVDIKANGQDGPLTLGPSSSAVLTWSSQNATSCTASGAWSGQKQISGTETTSLITSVKTFTITCTGPGGTASDSVIISPTSAVMVSIKANDTNSLLSVDNYSSVKLTWSSQNATSCTASGAWSGSRFIFGEEQLPRYQNPTNLNWERVYTITCTGPGGTASDSVRVIVGAESPNPTVKIKINNLEQHLILTQSDFLKPPHSQSFYLSWSSTNASYCRVSARDSMGNSPAAYSQGWSGSKALIGVETKTIRGGYNSPWWTTYGIECGGPGGIATDNITVYHFFRDHLNSSSLKETRPALSHLQCTHELTWRSVSTATFEVRAYVLDSNLNKVDIWSLSEKGGPILRINSFNTYGKDERVFIGSVLFDRVNQIKNAPYIGIYAYVYGSKDPKMPMTEILLDKFYHQVSPLSSFFSTGQGKSCYERSPYSSVPTPPTCIPNWECGEWSNCVNGQQTRSCILVNQCYISAPRPAGTRACSSSAPVQATCIPNWECGEWSACKDDKQTRTCRDLNNCSCADSNEYNCVIIAGRPPVSQNCSLSCKITDIYADTYQGSSWQFIFLRANNLPSENKYMIMGDSDIYSVDRWNGRSFTVITRNSDGSAVLKSDFSFSGTAKNRILANKSKVILAHLDEKTTQINYVPVCDYQGTASLIPIYPENQLASIADVISRIAQQIKDMFK